MEEGKEVEKAGKVEKVFTCQTCGYKGNRHGYAGHKCNKANGHLPTWDDNWTEAVQIKWLEVYEKLNCRG